MEIRIDVDTESIALPGIVVKVLDRAGETDLKVLLTLCAYPHLCAFDDRARGMAAIAAAAGCTSDEVQDALAFWRGAGVCDTRTRGGKRVRVSPSADVRKPVDIGETLTGAAPVEETSTAITSVPAAEATKTRKPTPQSELPRYTTEELTAILESRRDAAECIDECQRIWGKMFNTHEINMILGLVDYLGLDWEYVLVLLAYCLRAQEKRGIRKSLHYVESTAFGLYDEGVCDVAALHERIKQNEQMAEAEGRLRTLFGMGSRTLTPAEKKYFATWLCEYKFELDIIRRAYEITVDSKGEFKIRYMNSILANWHRDGLRTLEDIDRAEAAFRAEADRAKTAGSNATRARSAGAVSSPRSGGTANGTSYDVNDFFDAAVRRSLGDDFADHPAVDSQENR